MVPASLDGLKVEALVVDPISQWVGSYSHLVGPFWPLVIIAIVTALDGIVLSMRCGTGMASDRTEVTVVALAHAGLVRRACSCQNRHACRHSTSPRFI